MCNVETRGRLELKVYLTMVFWAWLGIFSGTRSLNKTFHVPIILSNEVVRWVSQKTRMSIFKLNEEIKNSGYLDIIIKIKIYSEIDN